MGGRPPKLTLDDATLDLIENLGKVHATNAEVARKLGVSRETFEKFIGNNPKAEDALENGKSAGKISLRHAQFKAALGGNTAMLVWMGKQLLDQKDKHEHGGDKNNPIQHVFRWMTETEAKTRGWA